MSSTLITNAKVISDGKIEQKDIIVEGQRIKKIGDDLQSSVTDEVIDAKNQFLLPGMIDDQVHFREPGLTHKADFATESAAAVAGGITSYMEMPNSQPQTINLAALADKYQRANGRSWANYAFYLGAVQDNLEEVKKIGDVDCAGLKIFMGASTGNMLVDDRDKLESLFRASPRMIVTHCEDTPMIQKNEAVFRERYGDKIPFSCHPEIRSREACIKSSQLALSLAKETDARLHILHLTTAEEANSMVTGPKDLSLLVNHKVTAEVCVHHLFFHSGDYESLGSLIKCNPAIKHLADRDALRRAVLEDRISVIATDHAPHTWEEKSNDYFKAPAGLPLVQHALPALLELVHDEIFSLEMVVKKTSHAVAELYKIPDRGYIREGYFADLVLVDMGVNEAVSDLPILSKCQWTPFLKHRFRSKVTHTWVNGSLAYAQERLQGEPLGQVLKVEVRR